MNSNGQAVTAETTLPEIWIPGDEKFNSYKHSLHEYCQKKHLPATQFKAIKEQNGFLGNVVFARLWAPRPSPSNSARKML